MKRIPSNTSTKSSSSTTSNSSVGGSSSSGTTLSKGSSSTLSKIASVKQGSAVSSAASSAGSTTSRKSSASSSAESITSSKSSNSTTSSAKVKSTQSTPRSNTNTIESKPFKFTNKKNDQTPTTPIEKKIKEDPKNSKPKVIEEEEVVLVLELRHQNISEIPRAHTSKIELLKLDISFNKFTEIQQLERYTKLTSLKVMYNKVTSLNGLETLENLRDCNMVGNMINDVTKLAFCKKLETLALDNNMIQSFPSLVSLKNLTHLSVENNCLVNFEGLSGLENLKSLSVSRNSIEKLTGLGKCRFRTSLMELDLSNNKIDKADFAFLPTFEKLEVLRMKCCNFKTIETFPTCTQIRDLSLSGNRIETILWIENKFPNLESVTLKDNYIPHVKQLQEELARLTSLEMVAVAGNPMCDINSNYVKILSTHLKNLRMIDEVSVNDFVTPDIDTSDPMLSTIGYVEPSFDDDEVLRGVLKREAASIKEADEVKDLFMNLQQQTKRLEKTFENSLANLDFGMREMRRGLDLDLGSGLRSARKQEPETDDPYDDSPTPTDVRSSQTLDMSEIRKALVLQVKKETTSKKEEQIVANVRRSLNNIERIRAAQQYSKQKETHNTDLELGKLNTDQHEAEVEQFLQLINTARNAEKRRPPSAVGGSTLKVKRKL